MKNLKNFEHINAGSLDEAISLLQRHGNKAWIMAGGTDLIGTMRFEVLEDYPEVVINIKSIPGLDYIKEEDGMLKIGALTRLQDIANNAIAKSRYTALSEAAGHTASPHIREMGTIGGNICQLIRCWYFRKEDNRFDCIRKGGTMCHAAVGDNRYHSIFGSVRVAAPPCISNCTAGNEIPSYLSSLRDSDVPEAAQILLNTNPIPAITGRVCPHACEKSCNRIELDEALSIRSIERFVGDYTLENAQKLYKAPSRVSKKKVAVVGSGPAGLSAAYYLRQLGYQVTVFEAMEEAGGVLTYGIPPYRLPKDVVKNQVKAIESTGVQFKYKVNIGQDMSLEVLQQEYDAVFCATGAWKQPALGLKGEELLTPGLEFLTHINQGLRKINAQKVLVIGGGSVAVDVALSALRLGAKAVSMASLESRDIMPALPDEIEQAVKEGVKLKPSWGPSRVLKANGKLSGMELVKCTSVYTSEHRFAPVYDNGVKETVEADMVVLAIGQRPNIAYAESSLKTNRGLIMVDPNTQVTSVDKVFAGGDATISGPLSVVAAVASGRRAAASINRFLGGKAVLKSEKKIEHLTHCDGDCLDKLRRERTPELKLSELSLDGEDILGLDSRAVTTEANRCLNCGCDGVNPSDMAAALVALDARIVTSKRTIPIDEFWVADQGLKPTALENDEIITEVQIPKPTSGARSSFIKFAMRKSIDFPIVNCAAAVETEDGVVKSARVCLNAVYSNPYRVTRAEELILGKHIDEASADAAGAAGVLDAVALPYNKFKIQIARTLVKRTILGCQ
jgi:NADPH-dependent glutamate synthase beta subunit-like oxidoreductase/CO/xanthine dehydrogenase FAD-binding subunit